jgi:hypothetical protein
LADTLAERFAPKEPAEPVRQAAPQVELYSSEERAVLKKYAEEFPEIAAAERLARRQEYQTIVSYVLNEVANMITPMTRTQEELLADRHLKNLQTGIPDYSDQLVDAVEAWAKTKPKFLQDAYMGVIKDGTDRDVLDLVALYKAETGTGGQTPAKPAPAAPATKPELPVQAKKAAAALAPVRSQRSQAPAEADPASFEDAFAQFARDI